MNKWYSIRCFQVQKKSHHKIMTHFTDIRNLLHDLEDALTMQSLWDEESPEQEILLSRTPFAMDKLEPHQWLQWIFIPKMNQAIQLQSIPNGFTMTPYFEECWKEKPAMATILKILREIERVCQ
ncbi:YqcC family protein [Vibrio salinus]|uniref:YqcC family protein n=1 Tax=Vibrio salinus TaxID=2899784 RepID=UPI001E5FD5FD|nr:YqcC family protein [Vibrio salinus]MCE0493061.1 YqcC family protein [Vibrio salinus]